MAQEDKYFQAEQVDVAALSSGTAGTPVAFLTPFTETTQDAITALGTTQATAAVLSTNAQNYNVTTAAASTGVKLPVSVTGSILVVANNGANAVLIYPATGEKINALATNAGFSAAINTVTILTCFTAGQWYTK